MQAPHCLHNQAVLHFLHALVQALLRVSRFNQDLLAADDRPGVNFWGYIVDGAAGYFHTSIEGLSDGMKAAKDGDYATICCGIGTACAIVG